MDVRIGMGFCGLSWGNIAGFQRRIYRVIWTFWAFCSM